MVHEDHVRLLKKGITPQEGKVWGDIGSGDGAFTLALRDILGEDAEIFSIDRDEKRLVAQRKHMEQLFPDSQIHYIVGDFMNSIPTPPLDGIVAANAIHFVADTLGALVHIKSFLKLQGKLVVIEYNVDSGNRWVPYPFSFSTFKNLATKAHAKEVSLVATVPSDFLGEMYCAVAQF